VQSTLPKSSLNASVNGKRTFCETCLKLFRERSFCDHCEQVYKPNADTLDGKLWIGCYDCDKWNHATCEINFGQDKNMKNVAQKEEDNNNRPEGEALEEEDDVPYYCLKCRRKRQAKERAQKKQLATNKQ
jgi:hypothetical protein